MNIFLRELKAHRKSLIFWCLGMIFMVVSGMGKFSGFRASSDQSMNALMKDMPKALKIIFGMYDFDLSTAIGYYAVLFAYILIIATIHASMLGANIISKEERDKTSEFLYVKPASRITIVVAKLTAAFVNMVVLNATACVSSIMILKSYDNTVQPGGTIVKMMGYMFILQLVFMAVGAVTAAYTKNPKTAASKSAAVLLVTYVLARAIEFNESLDFLVYVTPFKYFDTKALIDGTSISAVFYILAAVLIVGSLALTLKHYDKKDLSI